jgi:hypothetical protein
MIYKVTMVRVYETVLEVEASSADEALIKAQSDDSRYNEEMEQCGVSDEYYEVAESGTEWVECGYCHGESVPEDAQDECACPTCDGAGGYHRPVCAQG